MIARILFFLILSCTSQLTHALEGITHFNSDIAIHPDASLIIEETIEVIAEGDKIKHGIFRDFPTRYRDKTGKIKYIGFHIMRISMDEQNIYYHIEHNKNGQRIYIGSPDIRVSSGLHKYTIQYKTSNQILYLESYDELYWNVTGNFWMFPIAHASATVRLPEKASILHSYAYTGYYGQRDQNYTTQKITPTLMQFSTTRPLTETQGLTIAVGFPKGVVAPAPFLSIVDIITNSLYASVLLVFFYYFFIWLKIGRDLKLNVFPRFYPPKDCSPAVINYILNMGLNKSGSLACAFTATLTQMAVNGYCRFMQNDNKNKAFCLERTKKNADILTNEQHCINLFDNTTSCIVINNTYNPLISQSMSNLKNYIEKKYDCIYFLNNRVYLVPGITISLFMIACVWIFHPQFFDLEWPAFMAMGTLIGLNFIFASLIRAPTPAGKNMLEHIKGFKMYLKTADEMRLKNLDPPKMTPHIFENYLPYAIALGVAQQWGNAFVKNVSQSTLENYQPTWYMGITPNVWRDFNKSGEVISNISGFSSTLATAATAPSSSGGSSGNGSSGDGGGGGGGGGW